MKKVYYITYLSIIILALSCNNNQENTDPNSISSKDSIVNESIVLVSDELPAIVKNKFESEYNEAKNVYWEFTEEVCIVYFEIENEQFELSYDRTGKILSQIKYTTDISQLPDGVEVYIGTNYPFSEITQISKIETTEENTRYVVEIRINEINDEEMNGSDIPSLYKLTFDNNGNLIE